MRTSAQVSDAFPLEGEEAVGRTLRLPTRNRRCATIQLPEVAMPPARELSMIGLGFGDVTHSSVVFGCVCARATGCPQSGIPTVPQFLQNV